MTGPQNAPERGSNPAPPTSGEPVLKPTGTGSGSLCGGNPRRLQRGGCHVVSGVARAPPALQAVPGDATVDRRLSPNSPEMRLGSAIYCSIALYNRKYLSDSSI